MDFIKYKYIIYRQTWSDLSLRVGVEKPVLEEIVDKAETWGPEAFEPLKDRWEVVELRATLSNGGVETAVRACNIAIGNIIFDVI